MPYPSPADDPGIMPAAAFLALAVLTPLGAVMALVVWLGGLA